MPQINRQRRSHFQQYKQGSLAILPLCIAVIPWGILAGSYAIDTGLSVFEAQAMSAILFAGSLQLVALGMFKEEVGIVTLLLTTFFITSRHFLYSISMRDKISQLSSPWRLLLGFLLTDELFAICSNQSKQAFNPWYALGAGSSFYFVWNLASFIGIIAGSHIPSFSEIRLDFAVAATFIALVIPQITSLPTLITVLVSLIIAVYLYISQVQEGLIIASICGMTSGYLSECFLKKDNRIDSSITEDKA
jgi:4-azaleucine resistance transporter AzlC